MWITLNQDYVAFWYCDISQNTICFLADIIWYVHGTSEQVYFWILLGPTGWAKAMYVNDIWCWGGDTRSQQGFQIICYKHCTCCDLPYDTMWFYIRIAWSDDMALGWHDMIWYGMVWYGMIWYGMVWYMVWYDMIWYDMIWYDMIWYDMIWYIGVFHCFATHSVTSVKISKSNDHRIICKF